MAISTLATRSPYRTCNRWDLGGGAHASLLLREVHGKLKLSYSSTRDSQLHFMNENLYVAAEYTSLVANLFRDVIALNLRAQVNSASFAAVFVSVPYVKNERNYVLLDRFRVALFGQVDRETRTIREARWGVLDESAGTTRAIEVPDPTELVRECLLNVLGRGQTIRLYERARAVATCDADGRIQFIALEAMHQRASLYDERVLLDERNGAVTLFSAGVGSLLHYNTFGINVVDENSGHAMLAFEGIDRDGPFLKYAHITKERGSFFGRVEVIGGWMDPVGDRLLMGPTWRRTMIAIERALSPIQVASDRNERRLFVFGWQAPALTSIAAGTAAVGASAVTVYCALKFFRSPASMISLENIDAIAATMSRNQLLEGTAEYLRNEAATGLWSSMIDAYHTNLARVFYQAHSFVFARGTAIAGSLSAIFGVWGSGTDCLRWSRERLAETGVHIPFPLSQPTPRRMIASLRAHPERVRLED